MAELPLPLGYNTYCLRALRWNDAQLLEFAAAHKLDAIFLQDSLDPRAMDPGHWNEVREMARRLGLHLETGGGGILPKRAGDLEQSIATLRRHIERAAAMGSPFVRCVLAADRAALPGGVEQGMEWAVKILRAVRPELASLEANGDLLRQMAASSGGESFGEEEAYALAARLEPLSMEKVVESTTILWQSYWWFLPIIAFLTAEWICRKWMGMP